MPKPTPTPEPEVLKVVGQIGGPTQAVAVQGKYAYVGVGLRMVVLDVSNPPSPREVGVTSPFEWYVADVAVSGDSAYVAAGEVLYILDISDAAHPKVVGVYNSLGYVEGVAVSGRYAYIADGPAGLRVVDISDQAHPVEVAAAYRLNYAADVVVEGGYAYIAATGAGLLVVDMSAPTQPREAGSLDTPGYAYGVAVSQGTAYIADGWQGLRVVDISDPSKPREVGALDTPGWAFDVIVSEGTAYVADAWGGLRVVDVINLARPTEVGSIEPAGGHAAKLAIRGKTLYIADRNKGLRLLDLSTPAKLAQVGFYGPLGFADDVAVAGKYAYVAAGPYGLRVIDITDFARPREVGAYDIPGYAWAIAVDGNYAYVTSLPTAVHRGRLHVIDISNPAKPTQAAYLEQPPDPPRNMVIKGGILYGANEHGLLLIDVSDPRAPAQLGFIQLEEPTGSTVDVAVSSNMAYVVQEGAGLKIVDVSDPKAPVLVGVYDSSDVIKVMSVAVVGNLAYLGDHHRLHVVDVSDPKNPKGLGFYPVPGIIDRMALVGDTLYLVSGAPGLQTVDISDRKTPLISGARYVPGYVAGLAVDSNYVYVTAEDGGMSILERSASSAAASARATNGFERLRGSRETAIVPIQTVAYREAPGSAPAPLSMATQTEASRVPVDLDNTIGPVDSPRDSAISLASPGILTVTSSADSGPGTLRWAMENARTGDTITFDPVAFPPSKPATIRLTSGLPLLKQGNLTIDASNAGMILNGENTPAGTYGFRIFSDGNVIRGLQIINFPGDGIHISNAKNNTIGGNRARGSGPLGAGNLLSGNGSGVGMFGPAATGNKVMGNYIGTDITGMRAMSNRYNGITLTGGASHNLIGGTTPDERNIISGNGWSGVTLLDVGTSNNKIMGNYIGLDASGTRTLGHVDSGIFIGQGASGNIIGGTAPGERNVVSANGREEIGLMTGVNGNIIVGNYIGTDAAGAVNLGNAIMAGVTMELGPFNNRIQGNVISTSGGVGVMISDWGSWGNEVIGNFIGVDASGTVFLGGTGGGIDVNAPFNKIGGTTAAERNVISGNGSVGIKIGLHSMGDVIVVGNFIGTDASGTKAIGNSSYGIALFEGTHHSFIGGATKGERNVISGNQGGGIQLEGVGVRYNFVAGNYVGTDAAGTVALPNDTGINVEGGERNVIQANLLSGNKRAVRLGKGAALNWVRANRIGTAADSVSPLTNGIGIHIYGASNNTVGGPSREDGNFVAYNGKCGVTVTAGAGNIIFHNSFIENVCNGYDDGRDNHWDFSREGNYWSDYKGKDENGDGIGDMPYPVSPNGVDNHPLMKPFEAQ